jgi:hypothetical protein
MGNYNPHSPQILGNEFVGIREEDLTFDPLANTFERGYGFSLTTPRQVDTVRPYIKKFPYRYIQNQVLTTNIYPRGLEADSGPIRRVVIPCNAGTVTGDDGEPFPTPSFFFIGGATDVPTAFWNPSSESGIAYRIGYLYRSGTAIFFAVNQFEPLLYDKRILGVNFLVSVDYGVVWPGFEPNDQGYLRMYLANDWNTINQGVFGSGAVEYPPLFTPQTPQTDVRLDRVPLGDVSRYYGVTGNNPGNATSNISSWTFNELKRFEASAADRIHIQLFGTLVGIISGQSTVLISYAALEVFYCEETRVGYGSKLVQFTDFFTTPQVPYTLGGYPIIMRNTSGGRLTLPAGDYTVTLNQSNLGDSIDGLRTSFSTPTFNELRTLNTLATVPGIQVNLPFPLNDEAINTTLTSDDNIVLIPQLSLHASGSAGTLFESHGYGRQSAGQVWGTQSVQQRVDTSLIGGTGTYPWLRYWARRWCDTTGSLRATLGASTASITVAEFDLLDEIVDGYKEVTLRWDTAPTLSSTTYPLITWASTTGVAKGNRWEVLGVSAMAVTGVPGNELRLVPSPNSLVLTTYGQPVSGGLISEAWLPWQGPYVSGSTFDSSSDVSFLLAQDSPNVSGFALSVQSQALTGIGQNCGLDPAFIPSSLYYTQLDWTAPAPTGSSVIVDTFGRTVTGGWGTATSGQIWTTSGGTAADYNVSGGFGTVSLPDTAASRNVYVGSGLADVDIYAELTVPALATGGAYAAALLGRQTFAANNFYTLLAEMDTTGNVDVFIESNVGGVFTTLSTSANAFAYTAGASLGFRFRLIGSTILGKIWNRSTGIEPTGWTVTATDTNIASGGVGIRQERGGGNTNVGLVLSWDNFLASYVPPSTFGYYEVQRSDTITDWQTIAKVTNSLTTQLKDYEARIGVLTSYRARVVDVYGFYGSWTATLTTTIAAPGVAGTQITADDRVLVFTSNQAQSGIHNLAYCLAFDGEPTESFSFPEAGTVQLQAMYDRNFYTAFHSLERGGEQFSREVLVQAAAIPPETLADFTSLRDMAWASLPYVCVRDEDGNRWYASITVPSGRVQLNRTIYRAAIGVAEVTDIAAPVTMP